MTDEVVGGEVRRPAADQMPVAPVGQPDPATAPVPRGWLVTELWLVFALSLGASGVRAALSLLADLASDVPLGHLSAVLNASLAPGRPWLE